MKMSMLTETSLVFLLTLSLVSGSGRFSMRLVSFINPWGKGDNGNCCDGVAFFCHSACDHQFTICLDTVSGSPELSSCRFGRIVTGEVRDLDSITFGNSIGGTRNPIVFPMTVLPGYLRIKVGIWDVDTNNAYDYVDYIAANVALNPGRSEATSPSQRTIVRRRVTLNIDVKSYCDPGFYGSDCSVFCQDGVLGHYKCDTSTGVKHCLEGWQGTNCDASIDDCASNPCSNGGVCVDKHKGFICECPNAFEGVFCEQRVAPCVSDPCQNGGVCVDIGDTYMCACLGGWTGLNCTEDVDQCLSSPCRNAVTCVDQQGDFSCHCSDGYTGKTCDVDIDECDGDPCLNDGSCTDIINGFHCACPYGYSGKHCEYEFDHCESSPCKNGANCSSFLDGFRCVCAEGYTGTRCDVEVDLCVSQPCLNGATCVNYRTDFICSCPGGFTGSSCEVDLDECSSLPCLNNATCIDGVANVTCECMKGFSGHYCEINIDDCTDSVCLNNGTCIDEIGGHACQCAQDFTGEYCEIEITTVTVTKVSRQHATTQSIVKGETTTESATSSTETALRESTLTTNISLENVSDTGSETTVDYQTTLSSVQNISSSSDFDCSNCTLNVTSTDEITTLSTATTEKVSSPCFPLYVKAKLASRDRKKLDGKLADLLKTYTGIAGNVQVVSKLAYFNDGNGDAVTEISMNATIGGKQLQMNDIAEFCRSLPFENFLTDLTYPIFSGSRFPISSSSTQSAAQTGTSFTVAMILVAVGVAVGVSLLIAFIIYRKRKDSKFLTPELGSVDETSSHFENQLYMQPDPEQYAVQNRAMSME